jgi:hypothetical protein
MAAAAELTEGELDLTPASFFAADARLTACRSIPDDSGLPGILHEAVYCGLLSHNALKNAIIEKAVDLQLTLI